jgi:hypothetical protein
MGNRKSKEELRSKPNKNRSQERESEAEFKEKCPNKTTPIDLLDKNKNEDSKDDQIVKSSNSVSTNLNLSRQESKDEDSDCLDGVSLSSKNSQDSTHFDGNVEMVKSSDFKIYEPSKINLLHDQSIEKIRQRKKRFVDDVFQPNIKSLIKDAESLYANELFDSFKCHLSEHNMNELNEKIKWKRCSVRS